MDPITDWFLIQNNLFEGNPSSCALLPAATLLTNKLSGGGGRGSNIAFSDYLQTIQIHYRIGPQIDSEDDHQALIIGGLGCQNNN